MVLGGDFATTFCLVTRACSSTACPVLLGPCPFLSPCFVQPLSPACPARAWCNYSEEAEDEAGMEDAA